jgi:hypothetical protein
VEEQFCLIQHDWIIYEKGFTLTTDLFERMIQGLMYLRFGGGLDIKEYYHIFRKNLILRGKLKPLSIGQKHLSGTLPFIPAGFGDGPTRSPGKAKR